VTGWDDDNSEQGVDVRECVAETVVSSVVRGVKSSRNLGGGRCGAANGGGSLGGGCVDDSFRLGGAA